MERGREGISPREIQDLLYPLHTLENFVFLWNVVFSISLVFWINPHESREIQGLVYPLQARADFVFLLDFEFCISLHFGIYPYESHGIQDLVALHKRISLYFLTKWTFSFWDDIWCDVQWKDEWMNIGFQWSITLHHNGHTISNFESKGHKAAIIDSAEVGTS